MQTIKFNLTKDLLIEIQGDRPQDLIRQVAFWQSLPTECGVCKSPVVLDYQTPQTYKYYKLKCVGPTPHSINLSERQDGSGMYFDKSKAWETWRAGATEEQSAAANEANLAPEHQNAGGTWRSATIKAVQDLHNQCRTAGHVEANRVRLSNLGAYNDNQLTGARDFLRYLLNNAGQVPPDLRTR